MPEFLEVAPKVKLLMTSARRKLLDYGQPGVKEAVVAATKLLRESHTSMEAGNPEVSALTETWQLRNQI